MAKAKRPATPSKAPTGKAPPVAGKAGKGPEASRKWTFLTNHSHVLIVLHARPGVVLREIAALVGITERAVQQIVLDLDEAGVVEKTKVGRQNHYRIRANAALRHPIEAHCKIADLLKLIVEHPKAKLRE